MLVVRHHWFVGCSYLITRFLSREGVVRLLVEYALAPLNALLVFEVHGVFKLDECLVADGRMHILRNILTTFLVRLVMLNIWMLMFYLESGEVFLTLSFVLLLLSYRLCITIYLL